VRGPATLNNARENIPPRNIIKEAVPQQAAPIRATVVPERKVEIPERKIEVLKKIPEASANEQKVKAETRQQQNPKPMENIKIVPPVRPNSPAIISQQQRPPENTEKTQATPKGEQITQQKVSNENVKLEDNTKDLKKEARTEMQQRRR
jgi:archaellum component FlaD/FlaE